MAERKQTRCEYLRNAISMEIQPESLSTTRHHVGQRLPLVPHRQAAGVSIANAPLIFRIWRSPLLQRFRRCDSSLQLRAAADRHIWFGKGQTIRAKGLLARIMKEAAYANLESHSLLTTYLPGCIAPSVSHVSVHLVTSFHTLSNQSRSLQLIRAPPQTTTLIYIALRLVLIARRVHHLDNT